MDTVLPLPEPGFADVCIIAASPETARQIAAVLRRSFAGTEQRSYPTGPGGDGTRLQLTVDTTRPPDPGERCRPWLVTDAPRAIGRPQADEA
jgi:hypothetical protein